MEFRVLGPLEVYEGGHPVPLPGARLRALLALLLLNANQVVTADRLIDGLWGESPPAGARKTLQVYVSRLRKELGPERIATHPGGYAIALEPDELDLRRFERLVEEGKAELAAGDPAAARDHLGAALDVWHGPALADLAFEPFAQVEALRLDELRLAALAERIEADLALRGHAELVGELEGLIAQYPLRERFRWQLMLALYRSGRQAEALEAYRQARRALVDELGIEPAAALKELEQAILDHDPALDLPGHRTPPIEEPPTEERKIVTVLFADLGAASVRESDPERLRAFLRRAQSEAVEELEAAGARLEWAVADALLATFGAPAAKEDHAERALHAALAARVRLGAAFGDELALRIGVESGAIVTGGSGEDRPPLAGAPVASAARLARDAEGGQIVIGSRAARLAGGAFELHSHDGAHLLVRALAPARPRGVRGLGRAFVGRDAELDLLRVTYEHVAGSQQPHLVTIVGDAGVGKTSLTRTFRQRIQRGPVRWFEGRCLAYGRAVTYRPLAQILRQRLGLGDELPEEAIVERLGARRILGLTLGLDAGDELSPLDARERLRAAWVGLLEEIAGEGVPAVVVLEDLHWADEALLELLDQVVRDASGPLMLVSTARPELVDRLPSWGAGRRNLSRIWLEPLSRGDAERMLDEIATELPDRVRALVLERAEGNPFFVEEVLQSLLDSGALEREGDAWAAAEVPEAIGVPDSIQAVIASRIDLLRAVDKAALQAAAVVGRSFWGEPAARARRQAAARPRALAGARLRAPDPHFLARRRARVLVQARADA